MLRFIGFIVVIAIVGAALTRPSLTDVEDDIATMIRGEIEAGSLDDISDPVAALLFAACKAEATACADIARLGLRVTYTDRKLFGQVQIAGYGREATCFAAFARLFCPRGLQR